MSYFPDQQLHAIGKREHGTAGRVQGVLNRKTQQFEQDLWKVYQQRGGVQGLAEFAQAKPELFYGFLMKRLPEVLSESKGNTVQVYVYGQPVVKMIGQGQGEEEGGELSAGGARALGPEVGTVSPDRSGHARIQHDSSNSVSPDSQDMSVSPDSTE